ncbi:GLPGLI family protein [Rufibacter latericius]|uniref:GLPGLI family protein n=1 Tax=Rufibacter latericius TaxID=2487040 RepID=A0A3M9N0A5_9BACT|nr:GLPGLI family protein [Rufibacter latericius]RNI30448.1 GLPGLI family protein [Rufibacter latericius]
MKILKFTLALLALLCTLSPAWAQEGVIVYEVKMNMHRALSKEREAMKAMIPEYNVSKQALYFSPEASLYKRLVDEEEEATAGSGGVMIRMRNANGELYLKPAEAKRVALREFNGKKYLVQDSLAMLPWKLVEKTKTVAGYPCKQAHYFDEKRKQNVVAWYTDKMRPFLGPDSFASLPGAVLEVDINEGERVIKALQVDLRPLKKGELVEPTKGEKITEKQFQALMSEQMERMRQNGGNMIIRN